MSVQYKNQVSLDDLMPLIRECLERNQAVCFSPRGTSMLPMLRESVDRVVLSPVPEKLHKYDLPLYQRDNGQYVLHRIVSAGEQYTCIGDNQFIMEYGVRRDQMIAVVTAFYRNGRYFNIQDWGYQLYCRLWHYSRPLRNIFCRIKHRIRRLLK